MADDLELSGELLFRSSPDGPVRLRVQGLNGNVWAGGNGVDGDLLLYRGSGDNRTVARASIHLDGHEANIWAGGNGADGDLLLLPAAARNNVKAQARIRLDAEAANIWVGGSGADGDIAIFPRAARPGAGGADRSQATILLDGDSGDIVLQNADAAEDFDVHDPAGVEPGDVLVADRSERLVRCCQAYDRRVVGVVSGAGAYRPGIVLGREGRRPDRLPIALMGRVRCKVDADPAPVRVGDLLTTADRPGHAMRMIDREAGFGAVLGKALGDLEGGAGLIPILVALQ